MSTLGEARGLLYRTQMTPARENSARLGSVRDRRVLDDRPRKNRTIGIRDKTARHTAPR